MTYTILTIVVLLSRLWRWSYKRVCANLDAGRVWWKDKE
jgi:hypothetical protein